MPNCASSELNFGTCSCLVATRHPECANKERSFTNHMKASLLTQRTYFVFFGLSEADPSKVTFNFLKTSQSNMAGSGIPSRHQAAKSVLRISRSEILSNTDWRCLSTAVQLAALKVAESHQTNKALTLPRWPMRKRSETRWHFEALRNTSAWRTIRTGSCMNARSPSAFNPSSRSLKNGTESTTRQMPMSACLKQARATVRCDERLTCRFKRPMKGMMTPMKMNGRQRKWRKPSRSRHCLSKYDYAMWVSVFAFGFVKEIILWTMHRVQAASRKQSFKGYGRGSSRKRCESSRGRVE